MSPAAEERLIVVLERLAAVLEPDRRANVAGANATDLCAFVGRADVVEKLCISGLELARLLDISERALRRLDASGRIPAAIRLGGSKRWYVAEIQAWLKAGGPRRQQWAWREGS